MQLFIIFSWVYLVTFGYVKLEVAVNNKETGERFRVGPFKIERMGLDIE